jgi:hypothetical protein
MTAASVVLLAALSPSPPPQPAGPAQKDIQAAREKAIDYLKKQQNPQGTWEGTALNLLADMEGGMTALVTLSLLEAGVAPDDPAAQKAIAYLAALPPRKTYVVGLQIQALAKADRMKHAATIQKLADWLVGKAIRQGGQLGGWSYPGNSIPDGSNTHFAVAGLHAAAEAGAKVDGKLWVEIRDFYVRTRKDGGWTYHDTNFDKNPSRSMTAAALLGLNLAARHTKDADAGKDAFEKGMASFLPGGLMGGKSEGYMLMTTAELGRAIGKPTLASGKKELAWYREGAERLIKIQQADGSFSVGRGIDGQPVLMTAFGLYFLGPPEKK